MSRQTIFVLGLIGSILGIVGSIIWLFIGAYFFGAMVDYNFPDNAPLSDTALGLGGVLSFFQSGLTISGFIITLVKSTPSSLNNGLKNSGIWLLVVGIVCAVINLYNLVPTALLIIAGALAMSLDKNEAKNGLDEEQSISMTIP